MGRSLIANIREFLRGLFGDFVIDNYTITEAKDSVILGQIGDHVWLKDDKNKTITVFKITKDVQTSIKQISDNIWNKFMTDLAGFPPDERDEDS